MSKNLVIIGLVVLVLLLGGFLYSRSQTVVVTGPVLTSTPIEISPSPTPSPSPISLATPTVTITPPGTGTIQTTSNGFVPVTMTILTGQSITWVNEDAVSHQVNSDPHPTHRLYPILNTVGLINPGESKSVTFTTPGAYTYHDHLNPQLKGTVIVQ